METKIIKVVFGGRKYTTTAKRTRTDYGQMFEFVDIALPDTFEVIFSNSNTSAGTGKMMIGSNQRCLIPDEYLQTGQTIYAWVLVHDDEDDGRHMYSIKSPVDDMPDTSPEEPTPVEQSVISQAITALNSAVDTTTQKAQEASASADRAEHAAEGVESYAERAEAAQSASEDARDIALEAKVSAQASAATASEKASEAISSATTASQSALTAETASESARASATASAESASQASQSAESASESASASAGNANFAASKALDASNSASEAAQSASSASQSKTDAETAKQASETAQGLAESARDNAITAKTDAESARDEAQDIVDGITGKVEQIDSNTDRIESLEDDRYKPYPTDTASGAVASFPDGADNIPLKSCIVRVEPVQDLHGYDSPWPAGGGKNKFRTTLTSQTKNGTTFTVNDDGSITVKGTPTEQTRVTMYSGVFWTANEVGVFSSGTMPTGTRIFCSRTRSGAVTYPTISPTATAQVGDEYSTMLLEIGTSYNGAEFSIYPQIELGSTATSWTPYENTCPITGWTGCEVQRTGKNLLQCPFDTASGTSFGGLTVTYTDDGVITVKGTKTSSGTWTLKKMKLPAGTYTVYTNAELPSGMSLRVYHAASNITYATVRTMAVTFTLTEELELIVYILTQANLTGNVDITFRPQIEVGSTATDFVSYTGQTYPIAFPSEAGTVYGGYVDVTGGELVGTHCKYIFTGDEDIRKAEEYVKMPFVFSRVTTETDAPFGKGKANETYCNILKTEESKYHNIGDNSLVTNEVSRYSQILFRGDIFGDTVESAKAKLKELYENGTPMVVVGKIRDTVADNFRYPLTPVEIKTLLGQNNIWADTGDTSVEYRADTTLYISRLTEPDADMVADANITSGSYFMVGNNLYRATANIASGASVIVGTNAVKVSLAQALNEINA